MSGTILGKIESNGTIKDFYDRAVGSIDNKTIRFNGSEVGRLQDDQNPTRVSVYRNGSLVGSILPNGTVLYNNSTIADARGIPASWAAVVYFFIVFE
jgi:hypothetical protein